MRRQQPLFREIIRPGQEVAPAIRELVREVRVRHAWQAGRSWHPPDREPAGAAFLPMVEAEETYRDLSAKAKRVVTDGFSAHWSPDGKKLAFSLGVQGYSGVALYDPATKETELLIVPGKDPAWSPDGRYIAFVRDCQVLRRPGIRDGRAQDEAAIAQMDEEVWVMKSDGTEPRRLARGGWPSWSQDSACVYYHVACGQRPLFDLHRRPGRRAETDHGVSRIPGPRCRRTISVWRTWKTGLLKVKDLASQTLVAEWPVPFGTCGGPGWSPTGNELCLGAMAAQGTEGLVDLPPRQREPLKILDGQIRVASWAPDGTKLVFHLGAPYFEIWTADLDPKISIIEALGPAHDDRRALPRNGGPLYPPDRGRPAGCLRLLRPRTVLRLPA